MVVSFGKTHSKLDLLDPKDHVHPLCKSQALELRGPEFESELQHDLVIQEPWEKH